MKHNKFIYKSLISAQIGEGAILHNRLYMILIWWMSIYYETKNPEIGWFERSRKVSIYFHKSFQDVFLILHFPNFLLARSYEFQRRDIFFNLIILLWIENNKQNSIVENLVIGFLSLLDWIGFWEI
jgi:hypothetical protein